MSKNIVICCDGAGNEFGAANSNVVKLYEVLHRDETQIAYYHPGVGTMGARNALTGIGEVDACHWSGVRIRHFRQRGRRVSVSHANI